MRERRKPSQIPGNPVFTLSDRQVEELNAWLVGVNERAAAQQESNERLMSKLNADQALPYYGASGGGLTFMFSPGGLGTNCTVQESITKEQIDLTEYDLW